MKLQKLTFIHRRDREFSRSPGGARTPREQVNFYEQVEQVLTDALRCSDVENMDLEQVSPRSTLARLAAGQARYRRMGYRLGPLQLKVNPGSEGLAGRSTWSQDAARHDPSQRVPSCDKESGLYGLTPTDSRQVFCIVTNFNSGSTAVLGPLCP